MSESRTLSPAEIAALPASFTSQIDITHVRLIDRTHNPFARGKILTRPGRIYWRNYPEDFTALPVVARGLLMHELCHIWQYETGRLNAANYLLNPKNWRYGYRVYDGANFDDYAIEAQADLLQDWFLITHGAHPRRHRRGHLPPSLDWLTNVIPFETNLTINPIS